MERVREKRTSKQNDADCSLQPSSKIQTTKPLHKERETSKQKTSVACRHMNIEQQLLYGLISDLDSTHVLSSSDISGLVVVLWFIIGSLGR